MYVMLFKIHVAYLIQTRSVLSIQFEVGCYPDVEQ